MCNFPARGDTHLFVALEGLEMTQNLSCQVFASTFRCAHEYDNRSTACFHERDAWLCFALSRSTNEHVVCQELWHSVWCLVRNN